MNIATLWIKTTDYNYQYYDKMFEQGNNLREYEIKHNETNVINKFYSNALIIKRL